LLSESPLLTVYVCPAAGAVDDDPDVISEKSSFAPYPELVVSEKSGGDPCFAGAFSSGLSPKIPPLLSNSPMATSFFHFLTNPF
jgi:hypothetical protein